MKESAEKATDPRQYDSDRLNWQVSGAEKSPSRVAFREALEEIMSPDAVRGRSVLDVGCGVGQLFNWLQSKGASRIVGIDPSERNVKISNESYPWATVTRATLHEYSSSDPHSSDIAIAVMVFEHIQDLHEAFRDVNMLLTEDGEFYLIIGDKDFHISNDPHIRGGRFKSTEVVRELGGSAVEAKTIRGYREDGSYKEMHDIFRDMTEVREAAGASGFDIVQERPILGPFSVPMTERNILVCHSFRLKKQIR